MDWWWSEMMGWLDEHSLTSNKASHPHRWRIKIEHVFHHFPSPFRCEVPHPNPSKPSKPPGSPSPSPSTVQEMCVSRPLVMRGIFARKRENGQQNAKTRKPRKRARKYKSAKVGQLWSSPDLAARQCKIIILRCNSGVDLCCTGTSSTE